MADKTLYQPARCLLSFGVPERLIYLFLSVYFLHVVFIASLDVVHLSHVGKLCIGFTAHRCCACCLQNQRLYMKFS